MTHDIRPGLAALTLLLATDDAGRRVDAQRLGPVMRAAGLAQLLHTGALHDAGDDVRAAGGRPAGPTAALLWGACRDGRSWRSAVGRDGRATVASAEDELSRAGLVTFSRHGIGPCRRTAAGVTAAGHTERELLGQRVSTLVRDPDCADPVSVLALGLHAMGIAHTVAVELPTMTRPTEQRLAACWPGPAQGVRRAARDRRITIM